MPELPRAVWKPTRTKMSRGNPNEYHIIWFDPGAAATGWGHLVLHAKAFARPERKVLPYVLSWDCGEFTGHEHEQLENAVTLMHNVRRNIYSPFMSKADIGTEDFALTQMVGGKNLLSPVRLNAVLDWEVRKLGLTLQYQDRTLRTSITRDRLTAFGFLGRFRKDEFAAMQHAITFMRRQKELSKTRPWKLSDGVSSNAYWDCACETTDTYGRGQCDLNHPR